MMGLRWQRVEEFLRSARVLADHTHPLFLEAVNRLPTLTGLSTENVKWALANALEVRPDTWDLELLLQRVPECGRVHVLLSANVFVGALRAIALGIAASSEVHVRPSRREPHMVQLLAKAAPGKFAIDEELRVAPGDHVWAYGSDETLRQLRKSLPAAAVLHENGHGFGVVVLAEREVHDAAAREHIARSIAVDTAAFDQRGCLSPRVVMIEGGPSLVREFSNSLAVALAEREHTIPRGPLTEDERADIARFRDTLCIAGMVLDAGSGLVSFEHENLPWFLPPAGRVLHVKSVRDVVEGLREVAVQLTTIGVTSLQSAIVVRLKRDLPQVRFAELGHMQQPMLDGPVDLRQLSFG